MTHNENLETSESRQELISAANSVPWTSFQTPASIAAGHDLLSVDQVLKNSIRSTQTEPKELGDRLVESGGKRLRPFLLSLIARSLSAVEKNSVWRGNEEDLHHLAAVSELVHTATLFHDDVIDQSELRRGIPAAHILKGNKTAVLVGDFVYAEAFFVLMERGLLHPSRELAHTVKTIVDGELFQLRVCQNRSLDILEYENIALAKTASLFAWCTGTGAWLVGSKKFTQAARFGELLGLAFQMADDLIDTFEINPFQASETEMNAWLEQAPPLPLIMAQTLNPAHAIGELWSSGSTLMTRDEKKNLINALQLRAASEEVLSQSLARVRENLFQSEGILKDLGIENEMAWTINTIEARAQEGAALSELAGSAARRNVII